MWKMKVREVYDNLEDLIWHDENYDVVRRCGYQDAETMWNENVLLQGSTNPKDFGIAKVNHKAEIQKGLKAFGKKYFDEIPLKEISELFKENCAMLLQEDGTEWSGILCGDNSSATFEVKGIKCNGLRLGWYKMPSGRYEINAYLM